MANAVELATAYLNLVPSLEGASSDIGRQLGSSKVQNEVGRAGDKAGKTYSSKFSRAGALAGKAAGLGIAAVATAGAAWAVQTARDLANVQRIGAQTEAVIRSTGGAAGRSREDVDRLAGSIEKMSGVEAETVTEGQNMLLTFKNIKGQRFDQATTAMTDMAVAMNKGKLEGIDMKSASIQLGKALNDPIKGVSALAKVGITFSDQQKEQIKTMVESGNISQAQGVILKELNSQFGGAAKAAGETFQGKIAKLNNAFGNFSEGLLAWTLPALEMLVGFLLGQALPALERFGAWIVSTVVPAAKQFAAGFAANILPAIRAVAGFLLSVLVPVVRTAAGALGSVVGFVLRNKDAFLALGIAVATFVVAMRTVAIVRSIVGFMKLLTLANIQATISQWRLNAAVLANPYVLIIAAIVALVAGLVWFFTKTETGRKIVSAAWGGIKAAIGAVSAWWTRTAWPAIRKGIDAMMSWFRSAGRVIASVWRALRDAIGSAWAWIRRQVFDRIRTGIAAVRFAFRVAQLGIAIIWANLRNLLRSGWAWINARVIAPFKLGLQILGTAFRIQKDRILNFWRTMRSGLQAVGAWIADRIFGPLRRALGRVGDAFRAVPGIVRGAWNKIKGAAARPINFVINTVYMKGIKKTWDRVADAVGLDNLKLPKINPIAFANGSENHVAQIARGGSMRLWAEPETGGEAYIPLAQSKRSRSTSILGAVAQRFGYGLTPFADGGIAGFFGDAWRKVKDVASSFLSGPAGLLKRLITGPMNSALGKIGGGSLGKIVSALPRKVVGGLIDKAKDLASSLFSSGSDLKGGGRFSGGPVMGWQNMWAVLKNAFPGATLNSAFRPGAITAVGTPSFHGRGRAIDVTPSMAIFNWLAKTFPNSSELIFSPAGRRQLYMGRQTMFGEPTRGDHWDHVHWAMANGGMFSGVYDQGGWIPNKGVGVNLSGRPEAVLDPDESQALKAGLHTGPLVGTMVTANPREAIDRLARMQRRAQVRAGLRG